MAAGATALMAAAGRGRDAEVSALLANGADVRVTSHDGSTAAGWAAKYEALYLCLLVYSSNAARVGRRHIICTKQLLQNEAVSLGGLH
jgi:ankyrin repeat protein